MQEHALVWFRHDLRIQDNPALAAAAKCGLPVIALFVHAPDEEGRWSPGAASNWWLHHALGGLADELARWDLPLTVRRGPTLEALRELSEEYDVRRVFWNRRYEPAALARDERVEKDLSGRGIEVRTFNSALLFEPEEIANRSGQPFRVFTPFWKHLYGRGAREPVAVDGRNLVPAPAPPGGLALGDLDLLPEIPWDSDFQPYWNPGADGAAEALDRFLEDAIQQYTSQRDLPGTDGTSRLSPYLHFGQIGPRQIWAAVQSAGLADSNDGFKFLSEIAWREFAYHLLHHFPETPERALNDRFHSFPWEPDADELARWQKGLTGYPVVDAGMRQLWRRGWMHNRVRMITASFLVKHLLQPWQEGAKWFWDTLVDADLASNTMGWQWTAGCGADAAPYFRVFNPILQGEKFDPEGVYVREYVPELSRLPNRYIHQPWEAPESVLREAGVSLGDTYPRPVVDHKAGRERALAAFAASRED